MQDTTDTMQDTTDTMQDTPAVAPASGPSSPALSDLASSATTTTSSSSSSLRSRRSSTLTLDLSSLPAAAPAAAASPPQPTNTLLFTGLDHPDLFRPDNLATLRGLVAQSAPLHAWAPLRSFRRIVASFYSASDAARVRAVWDGEALLGAVCRVYYGRPTPVGAPGEPGGGPGDHHLALPDAGKLFFISPPPSPPHDWEMRREGAPNKQVHADDLAEALAKLHHQAPSDEPDVPDVPADVPMPSPDSDADNSERSPPGRRGRSATLVIYQPAEHSRAAGLPAIAVEDMTDASTDQALNSATWRTIPAHTARPPVELMHDA